MIKDFSQFGKAVKWYIAKHYQVRTSNDFVNFYSSADLSLITNEVAQKIEQVFINLDTIPKCAYLYSEITPYDFLLKDGTTLSFRTSINRNPKIAPRTVGQAGLDKLNQYLGEFSDHPIKTQTDIKELFLNHTEKLLPVFIENFLQDTTYTVVFSYFKEKAKFVILRRDDAANIAFEPENFSFTKRKIDDWKESNTIKYRGLSIAEVQVHKNRTFKFRFFLNTFKDFIEYQGKTNETFGLTAEKAICDIFKLKINPPNFFKGRVNLQMESELQPILEQAFETLPRPVEYLGNKQGYRGESSKSSVDFMLQGGKTLSLKTNLQKMVCPPEVGQPNDKTFSIYFSDLLGGKLVNEKIFKSLVIDYAAEMLPTYMNHLFDCDYLLWIRKTKGKYEFKIFPKGFGANFKWNSKEISFTKDLSTWNESNTIKYGGKSLGEFQVQKHRHCFKFRFDFENMIKIVEDYIDN